ncbi:S-layer homology domain-containing protein [Cohnella herbarum]|uniref:Carbohydrate-binding protein n=1 Tax=Cohnella herbarum TaxID=2728023 RepID=A0A7Z2ZL92_9BACL|nr:S-layer homology domain-containing protein [Cohnella herbarum]QJD83813.1 hypothetical protein HH215_11890 [Cohnella herbarum]
MARVRVWFVLFLAAMLVGSAFPVHADEPSGGSSGGSSLADSGSYVRVKNKWKSNFLYEAAGGIVRYGETRGDDQSSHWLVEDFGGFKRLKNRATGHYVSVLPGMQRTDPLRSIAVAESTPDDQWIIEETSNRPGFYIIKNARDATANYVIHEENQLGFAQASTDINVTFESPQWAFEPVDDDIPVRLANQYRAGQYLYEDANGFVKFGELGATNKTAHWYLDVKSDVGGAQKTVTIRNRASGHVITQGLDWAQIKALPLDPGNPAKSEWVMAPNADPSFYSFKNVEAMQATPSLTYVLNTQFDGDTNARSNNWAQPEWGSSLWRVEVAPDLAPRRIVNFTLGDVGDKYLYELNGIVKYGPLDKNNKGAASSYLWITEDFDGAKRIRNLATGHYATNQNIVNDIDPLAALESPNGSGSDRWFVLPSDEYDDYVSVQSAVYADRYLNIMNLTGAVQASIVDPNSDPAQWLFEDPDFVSNGTPIYVRIQNEWQPYVLYEDMEGKLKYGNAALEDQRSHWVIEKFQGRKRIKNRATGHFINVEAMSGGRINVSNVEDSWRSAVWMIKDDKGVKLIQNVLDKNGAIGQQKYINLQNLNKYAEYSVINPGWGSPRWRFSIVKDPEPTNFRFKNKLTGQYLYESYSGGNIGELKFEDAAVDDLSSIWMKEDTGGGITYRLKNLKSGNYISMEHFAAGGHELETDPALPLQTVNQIDTAWDSVKWFVSPAPAEGYAVIRSGWTGEHFMYADPSGSLKVSKNISTQDKAQFVAELATIPDAPLPTAEIRIRSVASGKYLYENAKGVVMYGNPADNNGYSHWRIETIDGHQRLVNRVTGHAIKASAVSRVIESMPMEDPADPAFKWAIEHSPDGLNYVIRNLSAGIDDELINVQGGAGYAERGLYPINYGSVQWALESAPAEFEAPSWEEGRNSATATPIQSDTNVIRIVSHTNSAAGSKALYESDGEILLGPVDKQDASAQWIVQDFNGRKLIENVGSGSILWFGEEDGAVNGQWTIEDRLGYKVLRNGSQTEGSLLAVATGIDYGQSDNASDSLWTFEPIVSDVKYEAEDAFVSGGVREGKTGTGFTGKGYAVGFNSDKAKISFAVHAQSAGNYETVIRYRNAGAPKSLNVLVNGYPQTPILLSTVGGWTDIVVVAKLRAGMNSLSLQASSSGDSQAEIDYAIVKASVNKQYRGATVPYTTYEAEHATTNAEVIGPSRTYLEAASEASGRQAVRLDETGEFVEFKLAKPANSIVLRYSMPDSADGAGLQADLALYVNGVFKQNLNLTSKHAWEYGGYPWSNDPNQGNGHRFFDEIHALIGDVPAGATIKLQKDATSTADYYVIDLADMEQVANPYSKPASFVSLADYGASPNDGVDDTAAFVAAMADAKTQGKGLWIPQGEFDFGNELLYLDGITIRGAGMWYTKLKGAKFFGKGANIQVYDLLIDGDLNVRDDEASTHAFEGAFGIGSVIQDVWVEHSKTGLWLTKPKTSDELTQGLYMMGLRLRNLMADGINFCVGTSDSMMEQTDIRYPGDDGIAMWSTGGMASTNNTARFNTVSLPWLADNIVVFGGRDNKIQDNIAKDTIVNGAGIAVSTRFNPVPFSGTTIVERNTLIRTGSFDSGYGLNLGAIWLFASDKDLNGNIIVRDNLALDSTNSGIFAHGTFSMDNVLLQNIVVDGTGTNGIEASTGIKGRLILDNVIVRGERMAMVGPLPEGFTLAEQNEGLASVAKPFRVSLANGSTGPLALRAGQTDTLRVWNAAGLEVTANAIIQAEPSGIVTVGANGRISAILPGQGKVTVQVGADTRVFTLDVAVSANPGGGSSGDGGAGGGVVVTPGSAADNDKKLNGAAANSAAIEFVTDGSKPIGKVPFTVGTLTKFAKDHPESMIVIKHGDASYKFPAKLIVQMLKQSGIGDEANAVWEFSIQTVGSETANEIAAKATAQGMKIVGSPIDFSIKLYRGETVAAEFHSFGTTFVERTIGLKEAVDGTTAAAFVYDPGTGKFTYVPALFSMANGQTIVTIKSTGNSIYVIAVNPKSFKDTVGHWANKEISLLASKQILNGVSSDDFAPGKTVTRAEFASMIVRALALRDNGTKVAFKDVRPEDWFSETVKIASQQGIVQGNTDGTFGPHLTITREQMAVMAARALSLVAETEKPTGINAEGLQDLGLIHSWALESVHKVMSHGIMKGKTSLIFAPGDLASRAEAAVILSRLLQSMRLI